MVLLLEGQEYCYEIPYDATGGVKLLAAVEAALNVGGIIVERHCILSSKYMQLNESVYAIEAMCFKPAFNKPGKFYICIIEKQDEIAVCISKTCNDRG